MSNGMLFLLIVLVLLLIIAWNDNTPIGPA